MKGNLYFWAMLKNIKHFLLFSLVALTIVACENDVDLLEEYQEIPVIYGLIDPSVKTHMVRVQRAFLGEGNALLMAQNPDSILYDTANIRLYLEKLPFGSTTPTLIESFSPYYGVVKEEGLFTDQDHYVFRLESPNSIDVNAQYRLRFENIATGKKVTSTTRIIEPIIFSTFNNTTKVNLANPNPYQLRFSSPKYGREFGLIMRVKYLEMDTLSLAIEQKSVDYKLDNLVSRTVAGGEEMIFFLRGNDIFRYLGSAIGPASGSKKRILNSFKADYLFTVGTDDLYNYIKINAPSNTANFVPEFTNMSEGRGLFTCRYKTQVSDVVFNDLTYDSLLNGVYTKQIFE
jgi:hypothetical protein